MGGWLKAGVCLSVSLCASEDWLHGFLDPEGLRAVDG